MGSSGGHPLPQTREAARLWVPGPGKCLYDYCCCCPSLCLHLRLFVSGSENVLGINPNDPNTAEGQHSKIAGRSSEWALT